MLSQTMSLKSRTMHSVNQLSMVPDSQKKKQQHHLKRAVLVPQKNLISGGQRIPGDHSRVFLWAVKTLHGANLNNQKRKKKNYPVSQVNDSVTPPIRSPRISETLGSWQNKSAKSQKPNKLVV